MKKLSAIVLMLFIANVCFAQTETEPSVKKSLYGVQAGLFGAWAYNEAKLGNEFVLRSEIGLDGGYSYAESNSPKSQYLLIPSLSLGSRWYYNFKKRLKDGKSIDNNSANFLSLKLRYNPNWFEITNSKNVDYSNFVAFVASWGIRRDLGKNFDFETRLGMGYGFVSKTHEIFNGWFPDLSVRFGYSF